MSCMYGTVYTRVRVCGCVFLSVCWQYSLLLASFWWAAAAVRIASEMHGAGRPAREETRAS
jgi:hypothetical protein